MTARPGQWSLLTGDGKDPVAGDPDAVRRQASYYSDMAETILEEANRLATLGQDDELVGKYAKSLKDDLSDLSDEVRKAHGRYEGVGTALKPFASALDDARAESWGALQDAVKAHAAQTSADGMPNPHATGDQPLTSAQKAQQSSRTAAIHNANDALNRARTRLSNALGDLEEAGKKAAGMIKDESNDSLKDHHSWWDVVVKIIKVVVEILNYVVIVLAIAALFVTGLGFLIFVLSAIILALDLTLAMTGNGSWTDVLIDVIGLATCGIGGAAGKGASALEKGAFKQAVKLEAKNAGAEMGLFRRAVTFFGRRADATSKLGKLTEESLGNMSKLAGLKVGDKEMAETLAKLNALHDAFPGSAKIANRLALTNKLSNVTRVAGFTGLTSVVGNTALSPSNIPGLENVKPYDQGFSDYKESHVDEDRSGHAYDFKWNTLDYSTSSIFETAGPRAN
jgi:hypothetical protein